MLAVDVHFSKGQFLTEGLKLNIKILWEIKQWLKDQQVLKGKNYISNQGKLG